MARAGHIRTASRVVGAAIVALGIVVVLMWFLAFRYVVLAVVWIAILVVAYGTVRIADASGENGDE